MRRAINENPMVQVGLVVVLCLVVAVLFISRMSSSSDSSSSETPSGTAATADAVVADAGAVAVAPATAAPAVDSAAAVESGFTPGPGLPKDVVAAYDNGKVVALLVNRVPAIEDQELRRMVERLAAGEAGVKLFRTGIQRVARYSRITEGVNLNRSPAIIVIEPKRMTVGEFPAASISYGYRGQDSIKQTVRDMLYKGETLPYSPR